MTTLLRLGRPLAVVCLWSALLFHACSGGKPPHHPKVSETIAAHQGIPQPPDSRHLTADVKREVVAFVNQPGHGDFFVETRSDKLAHAPCSGCHEGAVPNNAQPQAHWDITLEHAPPQVMNCATCHDPAHHGDGLIFLSGTKTTFDRSYQVCRQCHFEQARDWAGGAHGKRLETWTGERIVRSCTGCHNPHQPKFHKRLPRHAATPTASDLPREANHPDTKESHHD